MSKAAHTPGPWFCDDKKGPALGIERQAKATVGVWAQARYDAALALDEYDPEYEKWLCGAWGTCSEEDIANARLIAAAPDLLEALEAAESFIASEYGDQVAQAVEGEFLARCARPTHRAICAAIAKAKGGDA